VDDATGEMVGFVGTGFVESPVSCESGDEVSTRPKVVVIWQKLDSWLPFFVTHKRRCAFMISYSMLYISCVFCLLVGLSCLIVLSHHTCDYCVSCFLYLGTWYLLYSGSITLHHSIIGNAIHTREGSRKSLPRSTVVISFLQLPTIPSSLRGERVCGVSV